MMRYVGGSRPDRALLGRDLLSRDADQGPIQGHGSGTFPWTRIRDISMDTDQGHIQGHGSVSKRVFLLKMLALCAGS